MPVFELEGTGRFATRLDRSRARGFTRFVGREGEMQILEDALEEVLAGRGQVVGVVGEAGVGKSRLCDEFMERCRARGLRTATGHGVSHGKSIPLLPVRQLYRAGMGLTDSDHGREAREKAAGRVLLRDPELCAGSAVSSSTSSASPIPSIRSRRWIPLTLVKRLQSYTHRVLRARSHQEAAVLLAEDLHWWDAASETWLPALIQAARETRTLLVGNFRPGVSRALGRALARPPDRPRATRRGGQRCAARRSAGTRPLAATRSSAASPGALRATPSSRRRSCSRCSSRVRLTGARGARQLAGEIGEIRIPESVHAVLAARIDQLDEESEVAPAASRCDRCELPSGAPRARRRARAGAPRRRPRHAGSA